MFDLTQQQRADLAELAGRLAPREQAALDPQDKTQRSLIQLILEASNKGPDRYPALHAGLDQAKATTDGVGDGVGDDVKIIDLGQDRGGRATARGWHAARGGAFLSGAATLVLDSDSHDLLALGATTQVGGTRAAAATRTATARPATERMTALTFYHAQRSPTDAPRFGVVKDVRTANLASTIPITVSAPVQRQSTGANIVIGLGRFEGPDCDYFYAESSNLTSPLLLVPFVGSATLPNNISGITSGGGIGGLNISAQIYVTTGKAYVTPYDDQKRLLGAVTASSGTPNVISWSYPYDGLGQDKTSSLRFNAKGQANDTISAFFYQFDVPVDNPIAPTFTFTVCSYDWPDQPSTQCFQIRDLQFWWHCLAAGTAVTLADGSTLPIERVDNTMRVMTGMGGSLAVEATTLGEHEDLGGPLGGVRQLITAGGLELILTAQHPVVTLMGPVMAEDLQPGDALLTASGPDTVRSCEPTDYRGTFHDLKLGNQEDRARGFVTLFGSLIANGIVVGDHGALASHYHTTRHSLDYMLPRLPKEYHTDYQSALADIAAQR